MFKDRNFIKYVLIGIVNTFVGFSFIFLFTYIGLIPEVSNLFGYIIGFFVSYFLNRRYNFKSKGNVLKELLRFLKVVIIAYIFNLVILFVCFRILDINVYYSQTIAFFGYFFLSYALMKLYVFNKAKG